MFKFYKILFLNSLILGTLISISSYSWLSMWMGLEINLLSMIPLMNQKMNIFSTEALMKYFISQSLASMIFLSSMILMFHFSSFQLPLKPLMMTLNSSLLMKMGTAPFHFWFPQIMEGLNWNLSFLMLTWQKIAPFILISYNFCISAFFLFIIISSSIIGSIQGLNQISLRKILTFSSINHMSWMISSLFNSLTLWGIYFIIYSLISLNIILIFKKMNMFYIQQLIMKLTQSKTTKLFLILNFFSLGGLPPFLGFLPKWFTINQLMTQNFWLISLILILFSLITLFFYLRLSISSLILNHSEILFPQHKTLQKFWMMFFNFLNLSGLMLVSLIFLIF